MKLFVDMLLLTCLRLVAASPKAPGKVEVLAGAAEAVEVVLEAASLTHCSFILLTDGHTSPHAVQQRLQSSAGMAVFEVPATPGTENVAEERDSPSTAGTEAGSVHQDANSTKIFLASVVAHARQLRQLSWCMTVVVVSESPAFLSAFAESADGGRLMVWSTKLLIVTRSSLSHLRRLLRHHWLFSNMNTVLLNLEYRSGRGDRCGLYILMPYSPKGAQVVRVATWSPAGGLEFLLDPGYALFPNKYENFHGAAVGVCVFHLPPYWIEEERLGPDGTSKILTGSGRDYTILLTLSRALNFTINILPHPRFYRDLDRLLNRRAFLSPLKLAMLTYTMERYDFSYIIEPATLGFSMAKPTLEPQWQSLYYPLRGSVWASILAVLVLLPSVLLLMSYVGNHLTPDVCRRLGVLAVMQDVFGILMWQDLMGHLSRGTSMRLLIAAWLLFAFIMGTAYRANLIAFLTFPKYPARAETLHQLIDVGGDVYSPDNLKVFVESFKVSSSPTHKTFLGMLKTVKTGNVLEDMQQMIGSDKLAYMYERMFMELTIIQHFTTERGNTPLYVAKENIVPMYCSFLYTPDAPFQPTFDRYLMAFHEAGLIKKWTDDILKKARLDSVKEQRNKRIQTATKEKQEMEVGEENGRDEGNEVIEYKEDRSNNPLTIVHMQGPLFLLLLGLFFSVVAFFMELLQAACLGHFQAPPTPRGLVR